MQTWPTTRLLASPENAWWDDLTTVDVRETRDMILERSLAEGLAAAQAELGNRLESWQWGTLHTVTFVSEPFGATEGFLWRLFFKRGPYPVCGGANTVNDTSWSVASEQPFAVESLPSLRMIVDLSDLGASLAMHTTGQSGHVGSAHYDDMITSWCNGDYHGMIWAEEPAAAPFVDTLLLTPVTTDVECCER
jgi:penicillin amidase